MATTPENIDELLERIQRDGIVRACSVFRRPPLPSRLLRELYDHRQDPLGRRFIAAYPLSPSDLLECLSEESEDSEALAMVAVNPRTPPHSLARLAEHPDPSVRSRAAGNSQLTARDLRALARDERVEVRVAVARNEAIRLQHQAELAKDADPSVRVALAGNAVLDPEVALFLSDDDSPLVRVQLVGCANVEDEQLLYWADSDREELQLALLKRSQLPPPVIESLVLARSATVRSEARARLEGFRDPVPATFVVRYGTEPERAALAAEPALPVPLQRVLSQDAAVPVLSALAANWEIDPDVTEHLIGRGVPEVLETLAENAGIQENALFSLAKAGDARVDALLAFRENLPASIVRMLAAGGSDSAYLRQKAVRGDPVEHLPETVSLNLARAPLPSLRALAARSPSLQPELLRDLAADPAPTVRLAVAENPVTPDLVLEALREDSDARVAKLAHGRWQNNRRARPVPSLGLTEATGEVMDPASSAPPAADGQGTSRDEPGVIGKLRRIFT